MVTINGEAIRPSPETMLRLAQTEEVTAEQGILKIFPGYATGNISATF